MSTFITLAIIWTAIYIIFLLVMIINDILPKKNDEKTDEELLESPDGKTPQQEEEKKKGREEEPVPVILTDKGFSVGGVEQVCRPFTPQPQNSQDSSLPAAGKEENDTEAAGQSPAESAFSQYASVAEEICPSYSDAYYKKELLPGLLNRGRARENRPNIQTKPLYDEI